MASISLGEVILATRLRLLCCGATAAGRTAAFPRRDEPLDEGGRRLAAGRVLGGPAPAMAFVAPDQAARETASLMKPRSNSAGALLAALAGEA